MNLLKNTGLLRRICNAPRKDGMSVRLLNFIAKIRNDRLR